VSEPFNKEARAKMLDIWARDGDAAWRAENLERLLRDGDMDDYDNVCGLISDLRELADDLDRLTGQLGEEDE
jgi:hypothetical protein